ncbi:hypothetical protein A374_05811 [Fictibacillus macauensis ZFHKF-1]|uniref:Lipoprotein n=1 Tax=Fictibacillus macauensis ZFHKF-1 TaxID=1196324 RepID=I8ALI5_9BACL|nr:hypothetical protein [Fictibacillus macauensis]EIT86454.1 hypothetical protein A374_05811 [Fictibacillus macauensis ZFHKF-1]
MKKWIAASMIAALTASIMSGCGNAKEESKTNAAHRETKEASPKEVQKKTKEQLSKEFFGLLNSSDQKKKEQFVEDYVTDQAKALFKQLIEQKAPKITKVTVEKSVNNEKGEDEYAMTLLNVHSNGKDKKIIGLFQEGKIVTFIPQYTKDGEEVAPFKTFLKKFN